MVNTCLCPEPEQLGQYVAGKLDLGSHEVIDQHVEGCEVCQQTVESLDRQAWLKLSPLPGVLPPLPRDPTLIELVARAKKLLPWSPVVTAEQRVPDRTPFVRPTLDEFLLCLSDIGLLTDEQIEALRGEQVSGAVNGDCQLLADRMVAEGRLTRFQADEVLRGRAACLVLGNYLLLEPIGAGGMGQVFKAFHRRMKRQVALKILSPELLASPTARARFQREVEVIAQLSSPHIVAAYDSAEADGRDFLVMEYVEGRDLADLVRERGPLPLAEALDGILQAARGLEHAHAAGIIHRDVKPANLLRDTRGAVKVFDLGLARLLFAPELPEDADRPPKDPAPGARPLDATPAASARSLTATGTVMGTAGFMAPEQGTEMRHVDHRADLYSLGCCLGYLLTGKPPYHGEDAMELLIAHRETPIPSLSTSRPDCPPGVDRLFRRLLAKRPDDRPATMREVIDELERLIGELADRDRAASCSTAVTPSTIPFRERRTWPRGYWLATGAAAVAASVLLAVFALPPLLGPSSTPQQDAGPHVSVPGGDRPGGLANSLDPKRAKGGLIELVHIPAGEFWMGSSETDSDAHPDERPRHRVKITQAFFLGKTEVTQAQYEEVMGINPSAFASRGRHGERVRGKDTRNHPVDSVSWMDAVRFCNRLSEREGLQPFYVIEGDKVTVRWTNGYRLPTEAEWEYACRAGSTTRWSFGENVADLGAFGWYAKNADDVTHPVGQKKPNAFGLYDLHGNVPEWCWDRYDAEYYNSSPLSDPPGSGKGGSRIYRGGAWNDSAPQTRSSSRNTLGVHYGVLTIVGLRVARNAN